MNKDPFFSTSQIFVQLIILKVSESFNVNYHVESMTELTYTFGMDGILIGRI